MEVVLSRELASRRIFPAIDISASNTRKSELLFEPAEFKQFEILRRGLAQLNHLEAMERLMELLKKYPTNSELLKVQK
jgi:transcription termination factor Rho